MDASEHFRGKKITLMGLGLLGRGVGDAEYLAKNGAQLIVTDLKTEEALKTSLERLKSYSNITYRLGGHDLADFQNRDFILKAAGVPLDSPFIAEAKKNNIPVRMSAAWMAQISGIPCVGVTGTRGKSTVTHMLQEVMERANMHVLLGGNIRGVSTLALLSDVTQNSIALMELDSWQLQGFAEVEMSPQVAVFTTFMSDHMNYYKHDTDAYLQDKAQIFLHQKSEDTLIVSTQALPALEKYKNKIRSHVFVADQAKFPKSWSLLIPGEHNKQNAVCAIEAARALGIDDDSIRAALAEFKGVPGRLQFLNESNGIKVYNDNSSTTPDATLAALRSLGDPKGRNIVLILGGDEKNLDMSALIQEIPKWCSKVVLFKERGTDRIRNEVFELSKRGIQVFEEEGLNATVARAFSTAVAGEILLYSPGFSSFGKYFTNEFDRGDQFVALVNART